MARVTLLVAMMAAVMAVGESCTCIRAEDPLKVYCTYYDVVIKGVALSEKLDSPTFGGRSFYREYTVRVDQAIRVPDSLKNANTIIVRAPIDGSLCGLAFFLNHDITILGRVNTEGKVETYSCNYQYSVLALADRAAPCPASGQ